MSNRTIRRALERATRKSERKNQLIQPTAAPKTLTATASGRIYPRSYDPNYVFQDDPDPADTPIETPVTHTPTSENRIAANRVNAQKSLGPTSSEGKAISALNALKHGLTGNTVLLDSDDVEAYQQRLDAHVEQFKPVTFEERRLVQSIHDAAWRLDRILNLESTIYAKGHIELQFCFTEIPENQRKSFIQLEIAERNEKKLRNLHIQEGRLQRQRARDIAALKQLIRERVAEEKAAEKTTEQNAQTARNAPKHQPQTHVGFEFSTPEIGSSLLQVDTSDALDNAVLPTGTLAADGENVVL